MNDISTPKILVCTVNSWNSRVGDNTFPLLLQGYPKDCIASLFIREETPDSQVCGKFFRISENKVMKSILHRNIKTGEVVTPEEEKTNGEYNQQVQRYQNKKHFYYFKLYAREIVWKLGKWKSPELNSFIDEFHPDIIVYEMSRYIHLNNIVRYIIKYTGAKGIGCFWDDTFTYKQEKSFGYKFLRFFQRRNLKKLAKATKNFFAITNKTKREADSCFDIDCVVLTKPILTSNPFIPPENKDIRHILYTGNLGIGRLDVIKNIASILRDLEGIELDIYTNTTLSTQEVDEIANNHVRIHKAVSQQEVQFLQKEADILLFVESLDNKNKIARLSFSTKITDYYSAGKCILAVGNSDLAPIEMFQDNKTAIVVTNMKELPNAIESLRDYNLISQYAEKAYQIGQSDYSYQKIKEAFYHSFM